LAIVLVVWIKINIWQRLARLEESFATVKSESFFLGIYGRETVFRLNSMLLRYQLSGDPVERDSFRKAAAELDQRFTRSKERLSTPAEQELIERLSAAYRGYLDTTAHLRERAIRAVRKESVSQVQEEIDERARPVLTLIDQLIEIERSAMAAFFLGSKEALNSLQQLLWLAVVLLLVLIGSVAALSYRMIVSPLRDRLSESRSLMERQERLASLGVLTAGVAHEIRNPLTAMKFRLFSLKKALPPAFQDHEDIATLASEVNRLERIVKDFLEFARPSEPLRMELSFPALLEQTQRLLQEELKTRGVDLTLRECPAVTVQADKQQLQQVLINLIRNGAESMAQGGTVTLAARRGATKLSKSAQPALIVDVTDTGKGISPEAEQRLFDPFFSTKANGTGLGLSIAAQIVEKHGGSIQYTTRLNHGTTFSVILPLEQAHESQNPAH
jgi:signal transduction histidine kinase